MNLSSLRYTTPFLAGLVALAAGAAAKAQVTIADLLHPGAVAGERGPYLVRLVDDLSGEPIAGAEVFLVAEHKTPMCGEFWFEHRGTSDAEGFVRIDGQHPVRRWHWQVAKHPTRGVAVRSAMEPIWRLGRGFDVPLVIQDWTGRPAPGARIGFCGGCGHSPDVASAVADADGVAVLRGIDPQQGIADLYVQHPGLHIFYESVDWRPGEPPRVVRCGMAPTVTGRVLDAGGMPVEGAYVCAGSIHRGPWARTAADGTFAVLGCEPRDSPHQVVLPDGREVSFSVDGEDPYPVTLRLPDLSDPEARHGTVEVADQAAPARPVLRRLRVVVEEAPAGFVWLAVTCRGQDDATESVDGHVDVPRGAPFVLRVTVDDSRSRQFWFADGAQVPDPLVVRWLPAGRVTGRAVDAAGARLEARVRWREGWSDAMQGGGWHASEGAGFALAVKDDRDEVRRWRLLELEPRDRSAPSRLLWVLAPACGEHVDLGDLVVGGPPQLAVRDVDGAPLATAIVAFARPGWQEPGQHEVWPLDATGGWRGPDLREGDAIAVRRAEDAVPFRTVLQGEGPWTIVPPDGELELAVVDAEGNPLAATVVVGDHEAFDQVGRIRLRGLRPGPTRLHIGAPGHRSATVDAEVGTAPGPIRVELPRR
ncbi:MAG: carboxypeptidase regulatory-like domain-containing protein [Planctomycetes bacterium]|nr:carboxypeptidase regulatory-like domain-containing protein [Planctomycetota bacterium]